MREGKEKRKGVTLTGHHSIMPHYRPAYGYEPYIPMTSKYTLSYSAPLFSIFVPWRCTAGGSCNSTASPLYSRVYERGVNGGASDDGHSRPFT